MKKLANPAFYSRLAFALLWAFVFSIPLSKVTEIPFVDVGSKLVGILAMLAGCVAVIISREIRFPGTLIGALAVFVGWSALTLGWSVAPNLTIVRSQDYLQLFVMVLLIWQFCKEEKQVLRLLDAFALGSIIPALATLLAFLPGQTALFQRAAAPKFEPNELAFLLALSLPVSCYLLHREQGVRSLFYRVSISLSLAVVVMIGSPAMILAALTGVVIAFFSIAQLTAHARVRVAVLLAVLGCPFAFLLPEGAIQQVENGASTAVMTFTGQIVDAVQHTPLRGLGSGTHGLDIAATGIGNSYVSVLVETGVVGFCCFICILGISLFSAEGMPGTTRSLWMALLAVLAIGVSSLSWESSQPAWLLLGLLAAHSACSKHQGAVDRIYAKKIFVDGGSEAGLDPLVS